MFSTMEREKGSRMQLEPRPRRHPPWWLLFLGQFVHWTLENKEREFQEDDHKATDTDLQ